MLNMLKLPLPILGNLGVKPSGVGFRDENQNNPRLIISLTRENREKLEGVIKELETISGEKFTPANVIYLGLNLVSLLVELQKHGGCLIAKTPEGDQKLTISDSGSN